MNRSEPVASSHGGEPARGARQEDPSAPTAPRNPGIPLDLDWVRDVRVDEHAVARRAETLARGAAAHTTPDAGSVAEEEGHVAGRDAWPRSPAPDRGQALLRVIALMDLTTLAGDDTATCVERLCATARRPLRAELLGALGTSPELVRVAAVCVYHRFIETATDALRGSGIRVATVSAGFPHGLSPLPQRVAEIEASVAAGADEIDAVIVREHVLTERWDALYDEVRAFRRACGDALLKVILATGELGTLSSVARASRVCMMAGADFIKTSTGKERVNATLPVGLTMAREIRAYAERTGYAVGLKPAGGIRSAADALPWLSLANEELGEEWLGPERFRFGASSLLADVERELELHAGGAGPPE